MKEIRCKICNSNKVIKKDDGYICDECGTTYTIDEMKDLLVEVSEAPAAVQQITSQKTVVPSSVSTALSDRKIVVPLAIIIVAVLGYLFWQNTLFGNDQKAYEILLKAANNFKYPSSVQLVSGSVMEDSMFANISAMNGLGVRSTSCYFISSSGYLLEEDDTSYCRNEGLHVSKINKKLEKELNP